MNSLIFDDIALTEDLRQALDALFRTEEMLRISENGIRLLPCDFNNTDPLPEFPAVGLEVISPSVYEPASDNAEIQGYTSFSVEINIYTSGENRQLNNKRIANAIIALLQSHLYMSHYSSSGLQLESKEFVTALVDNTSRQVIRMSALCDNSMLRIFNY